MTAQRIIIAKSPEKITIRWRGHIVATSANALELREGSYAPVIYMPRADADMAFFERSQRETTCPYKGTANYFTLKAADVVDANAVWTYETPKPEVSDIAGHLAFYADKVEIIRE